MFMWKRNYVYKNETTVSAAASGVCIYFAFLECVCVCVGACSPSEVVPPNDSWSR